MVCLVGVERMGVGFFLRIFCEIGLRRRCGFEKVVKFIKVNVVGEFRIGIVEEISVVFGSFN